LASNKSPMDNKISWWKGGSGSYGQFARHVWIILTEIFEFWCSKCKVWNYGEEHVILWSSCWKEINMTRWQLK
jgi:hypothetical protein